MSDESHTVSCPDCNGDVHMTLTLIARVDEDNGHRVFLCNYGVCRYCSFRGDRRSVREFTEVPLITIMQAAAHGLPVIVYKRT